MAKYRSRSSSFPLILAGITLAGLISALIDGTLGWETLAQSILRQTMN